MYQLIQIQNSDQAIHDNENPKTFHNHELDHFFTPSGLPALDPESISRHKADAHWMLVDSLGDVFARCSLWWSETPPYPAQQLGLIGHYAARNAEAGVQLLNLACDRLARQGCTMVIGPMNGNTWQQYRLLTERGSEPAFFLEPPVCAELSDSRRW